MSRVFVADIPEYCQVDEVKHLLIEEFTADEKDQGLLLFWLISPNESTGTDAWYESRQILDEIVLKHYGVNPWDWREYKGPRFW